jgi:hypothetical protein
MNEYLQKVLEDVYQQGGSSEWVLHITGDGARTIYTSSGIITDPHAVSASCKKVLGFDPREV